MSAPRHSLQGRLTALVLALVALVWAATAVVTWFDARHELDELLDGHLSQAAAMLVAQQARGIEDDYRVDAPVLHRYAPKAAFQVFHEGRLAMRSANAPALPMIAFDDRFRTGFRTVRIEGVAWRVFAAYGSERDVQVYVGEQVGSRASILWAVLRGTFWPMAVALPLLALAVWWAVRRGMVPLRKLGRELAARDPRSLNPVALDRQIAEMAPLVEAMNALFGRIGALMETERRFTADAAHELRTPIAAIRAQAQVALAEGDAERRGHALRATLEGCDRATHLVEQLLTLSRLEADAEAETAQVDLSGVVRQVVAELAPQALANGQTIDVDAPEVCRMPGHPLLLAVLVRNLVDNAIRYSPENAIAKVTLTADDARVRLIVEDSGPGMGEEDLRRLGERFFRVAGSGRSGSGLGWSIVRRVAAAHRAEVRACRSAALGGMAVEVDWPVRT